MQKEFVDDCVFSETMQENYNIYASLPHSTPQRTYYLALNKLGQPRITHLPAGKELGKLATYAKAMTLEVPANQSEAVIGRLFGTNHIKHALKQLCDSGKSLIDLTTTAMRPRPKCAAQQTALTVAPPTNAVLPRGMRKHRNNNGNSAQDKLRKPPSGRCADDGSSCPKRRKMPHPRLGGPAGPSGGQASKPNRNVGAKKPQPNKKGHRRKKLKDGDLTAKVRGNDRPTTTMATTTEEEANTEHLTLTSTESTDEDDDNSSIPSYGITSFADESNDDLLV